MMCFIVDFKLLRYITFCRIDFYSFSIQGDRGCVTVLYVLCLPNILYTMH